MQSALARVIKRGALQIGKLSCSGGKLSCSGSNLCITATMPQPYQGWRQSFEPVTPRITTHARLIVEIRFAHLTSSEQSSNVGPLRLQQQGLPNKHELALNLNHTILSLIANATPSGVVMVSDQGLQVMPPAKMLLCPPRRTGGGGLDFGAVSTSTEESCFPTTHGSLSAGPGKRLLPPKPTRVSTSSSALRKLSVPTSRDREWLENYLASGKACWPSEHRLLLPPPRRGLFCCLLWNASCACSTSALELTPS